MFWQTLLTNAKFLWYTKKQALHTCYAPHTDPWLHRRSRGVQRLQYKHPQLHCRCQGRHPADSQLCQGESAAIQTRKYSCIDKGNCNKRACLFHLDRQKRVALFWYKTSCSTPNQFWLSIKIKHHRIASSVICIMMRNCIIFFVDLMLYPLTLYILPSELSTFFAHACARRSGNLSLLDLQPFNYWIAGC